MYLGFCFIEIDKHIYKAFYKQFDVIKSFSKSSKSANDNNSIIRFYGPAKAFWV
jgi:hypothetical protein